MPILPGSESLVLEVLIGLTDSQHRIIPVSDIGVLLSEPSLQVLSLTGILINPPPPAASGSGPCDVGDYWRQAGIGR